MDVTGRKSQPRAGTIILLLGLALTGGCVAARQGSEGGAGPSAPYTLNSSGELIRPSEYRTWVYVGTPVTPHDMNDGKAAFPEHHNVYIDPASYEHYLRTGNWREGTTLVKELVSVGSKTAVSGNGYFQGDFLGLEATIKSAADFPEEPGNWAYFSFTNPEEPGGDLKSVAAAFPAASCNACHDASAQDDFVFTQYYPVLRAAKGAGTSPENRAQRPRTLSEAAGAQRTEEGKTVRFDASGREPAWRATRASPARVEGAGLPIGQQDIFEALRAGEYRSWASQDRSTHPSRSPHTQFGKPVRVFMNDTLAASMRSGGKEHPVGSTAVKEMYTSEEELIGWAVEIKTQSASEGGDGWFWYEVTSTTDASSPVAIGNAVAGCAGCHAGGGRDFVLSSWPLN